MQNALKTESVFTVIILQPPAEESTQAWEAGRSEVTALPSTCRVTYVPWDLSEGRPSLGLSFLFCKVEVMRPILSTLGSGKVQRSGVASGFPQLARLRGVPPLASQKASVEHRGPGLVVAFTGRGASAPQRPTCLPPPSQASRRGREACQGPREAGLVSLRP